MGAMIVSDIFLPLTPALSLGERGNHFPSRSKICRWICETPARRTTSIRNLFPLPEGEGRGEGERNILSQRWSTCESA